MMPILIKSDDVKRGRKVKVRHGRLQAARAVTGGHRRSRVVTGGYGRLTSCYFHVSILFVIVALGI